MDTPQPTIPQQPAPEDVPQFPAPSGPAPRSSHKKELIIGFLFLLVLVGGALWYSGLFGFKIGRTPAAETLVLDASCTVEFGREKVMLSWTIPSGEEVSAIERQDNGGEWRYLYRRGAFPLAGREFGDRTIITDATYTYRLTTNLQNQSNTVEITPTSDSCL